MRVPMSTRHTASSDDFRIAYDVQGSGPALLLLHGFSNDRTSWSSHGWVERLQSQYLVISMDLRGCGNSQGPADPTAYTIEHHLADVYAVMDACKVDDSRLFGWSFGATIGLHLAASSPRIIQAVVAGSYFGRIFTAEWIEPRVEQLKRLVNAQADGVLDQLDLSSHERALSSRTDLHVYLARVRALSTWPAVEPHDLRCPTLVYTGTEDGNVVGRLEEQRAAIEAAGHRLHVFDGFTHLQLLSELDTLSPVIHSFFHS